LMKKTFYIPLFIYLLLIYAGSSLYAQKITGKPLDSSTNFTASKCQLYVPNAFTPNGDNINERFTVKYSNDCNLFDFDMKIFDRWGRLVFHTTNPDQNEAWDGSFDGKEM